MGHQRISTRRIEPNSNLDTYSYSHGDRNRNCDCHRYGNSNLYTDSNTISDTERNSKCNCYCDGDSHANSYGYTGRNTNSSDGITRYNAVGHVAVDGERRWPKRYTIQALSGPKEHR